MRTRPCLLYSQVLEAPLLSYWDHPPLFGFPKEQETKLYSYRTGFGRG